MKFEYLKGSEKDFEGYHQCVTHIYATPSGHGVSSGSVPNLAGYVIAERRPITEPLAICKTCGTDHSDNGGKCRGLIISKPSQVWDGNFPISPGTLVDVHFQSDDSRFWTEFRVEYMRGDVVVLYDFRSDSVESYSNELLSFRPVRSPEDVARDEAIDDLVETMIYFYGNPKGTESYRGLAVRIIEAIKIGKIPGVKLE